MTPPARQLPARPADVPRSEPRTSGGPGPGSAGGIVPGSGKPLPRVDTGPKSSGRPIEAGPRILPAPTKPDRTREPGRRGGTSGGGVVTRPGGSVGGNAGGFGGGGAIGGSGGGVIKSAPRGGGIVAAPRDDFSRPLASTPSGSDPTRFNGDRDGRRGGDGQWRGGDRGDWRGGDRDDWRDHGGWRGRDRHDRSSFNISIGLSAGNFFCPPPPPRFRHCFGSFYDPFVFNSRFCGLPLAYYNYYRFHCGSFFICDNRPCFSSWYWRPVCVVDTFPCGSFFSVRYNSSPCDYSFRFCDVPCDTFSTCSLVSSCDTSWTWSTHGTYRYGWFSAPAVTTIVNETASEPATYGSETVPLVASATELRSTTQRELGDVYMRLGDLTNAVRVYGEHLDAHPGDVLAQRALGIALIAGDRTEEGIARIDLAYRIDPNLADRPFHTDVLSAENRIDRLTDAAAMLAAQKSTPEAWLTLAVLKQAEGQSSQARAALDKARDAGLAAPVVEAMQASLPLENRN